MAEYTTNYNLIKPAQTDFFNVDDLNENADKIDAALKTNADGISAANTAIGTNAAAIAENSTAITGNTAAIGQNTSDIATNTTAIGQNASNIAANTTAIGARVKYTDSLTLEEIIASTDLTDKVASAAAAKSIKESLSTSVTPVILPIGGQGHFSTLNVVARKVLPNLILVRGYVSHTSANGSGTTICTIDGINADTETISKTALFTQCDDGNAGRFISISNSGSKVLLTMQNGALAANTYLRIFGFITTT